MVFLAIVYFSVAPTSSTKRTCTQLKEDPLAKFNMDLLQTRKKKKVIVSWDLCSACVLDNGSLFVSILLGAAWCLAERSQETNRCELNQKRQKEKERHYHDQKIRKNKIWTKDFQSVTKRERERERFYIVILKY